MEDGARLVRCERVQEGELFVVEVRASASPAEELGEALAELVSEHLGDEVRLRYALVLEQEH